MSFVRNHPVISFFVLAYALDLGNVCRSAPSSPRAPCSPPSSSSS